MFDFLKKQKKIVLKMPFDGEVIPIEEVPDQVFSQKMLGDGFAINPKMGIQTVYSPIAGEVVQIFPTNHAIGFKSMDQVEMIIHIGIDTVELKGAGFKRLVEPPCQVLEQTALLAFDTALIIEAGKKTVTPFVFTEMKGIKSIKVNYGMLKLGDEVCEIILK